MVGDCHLLLLSRELAFPGVKESLGLRHGDVVVEIEFLGRWLPVPVRSLVLHHQAERLGGVATRLEPLDREIRDDLGGVAGVLNALAIADHRRVVVRALADEPFIVVKAGGLGLEVPLADQGGLVAGGLEEFGVGLLRAVELVAVLAEAVDVAVLACEDDRAGWPADGVGDVTAVEAHAAIGDAVDVGGLVAVGAVGADGLVGVVVGHDEEDVGGLGEGWRGETDRNQDGSSVGHGWKIADRRQGAERSLADRYRLRQSAAGCHRPVYVNLESENQGFRPSQWRRRWR